MPELKLDYPQPELTEEEGFATLATIQEGIAQLDAGQGISIEELRQEFSDRCRK